MDAHSQGLASALAELGISNLADLVDCARAGVLNEVILYAVEHRDLEQRVAEAVIVVAAAADRRSDRLARAEAQAEAAEMKHREVQARLCATEAAQPAKVVQPVSLSLQIRRRADVANAGTQMPTLGINRQSVGTQVPSPQEAAAAAKQQRQQQQRLEASAHERARAALVPVLARAVAASEAAEWAASQQQQDAQRRLEAVRPTAERAAREAASAAADRQAAAASVTAAAAAAEEETLETSATMCVGGVGVG